MTPELTQQEIEAIKKEAEEIYPDILINERGVMELWEMYEHNDIQGCKREAYIDALTSERLKHKAEIQVYREFLEYIIEVRKDESVSKEMLAVFAENIIKTINHQYKL